MTDSQKVMEMPPVVYSLIRWSAPTQRKGHSQERQDDFASRWCHQHGARLDDSMSMVLDGQGKHIKIRNSL